MSPTLTPLITSWHDISAINTSIRKEIDLYLFDLESQRLELFVTRDFVRLNNFLLWRSYYLIVVKETFIDFKNVEQNNQWKHYNK